CAGLPIRLGRLPSLIIARVIVAIIKIPKKKIPGPNVKEKRKAGTRAGLTKPAIAAAAKLIESIGPNGFSLRKLAKALGVGPILLLMFFGIQNGGFLRFRKRSNTHLYNALADPEPNRPEQDRSKRAANSSKACWRFRSGLNIRLYNALADPEPIRPSKVRAYQGRNTGPQGRCRGRLREGCPLAFVCEARSCRTGRGR